MADVLADMKLIAHSPVLRKVQITWLPRHCIIVISLQVYYAPDATVEGGFEGMYQRVKCLLGPEGNEDRSFLTFWSEGALIWGVQVSCPEMTFKKAFKTH